MASKEKDIELGNYRVLKNGDGLNWELGKGAFGTTFKAEHKHLPRFCALKVINENLIRRSNSKQRFLQEAQAASLLDHPNIAQIYDFGESDGVFYYAMTYCAGNDLENFAKANGPQPWSAIKKMAKQMFSALVEAHTKGLLHRDIKPSNIMLTENDGTVNIKLIDFGLVKVLEQSSNHKTNVLLTNEGGFLGSPLTASPEQLQEEDLDERSDLFSVGVTLWYLLVGGSPFEDTSTAQLVHQRLSPAPYDSEFPKDLEPEAVTILSKLLCKNKEKRYASAQEVLDDLNGSNLSYAEAQTHTEASSEEAEVEINEAEHLKEQVSEVDADWSEVWEILTIVHQDIHGTLYNCVSKQDATIKSSIFIPDSQEHTFQEVVSNADRFLELDVHVLSPFVSRGVYDGEICYLSTAYPTADVSLLIQQVGELRFSKYDHLFHSMANAIDEASAVGLPGLHLSHNEIKLAFSGQPMELTNDQWVNYFNGGALVNSLEVFIFPKFVDTQSVDDVSMTLSNEDLATSTLSSFAGFIYSAISGMKVKQSVYLTSSAHISTSNLSEESNDYLSKVIAAEIMPSTAREFLQKLSELENTSSDSTASIYTTQDMKRLRRDGLVEAHRSMSSMARVTLSPTEEKNLAQAIEATAANIPLQAAVEDTPKVEIAVQHFGEPAEAVKPEKKSKAKAQKPIKTTDKKLEPKKVEQTKDKKSIKLLIPVLLVLLGVGGYFTYEHLFEKKKKRRRSASTETVENGQHGENGSNPAMNPDGSDGSDPKITPTPSDPDSDPDPEPTPDPDPTPATVDGKKIYISVTDMKGLVVDEANKLVLTSEEGKELGELKLEKEKRFSVVLENDVFESWGDQAFILKLKSPHFRINQINLKKNDFVVSEEAQILITKVELNIAKVITLTPVINFSGNAYDDSSALLKQFLYPVDLNLDLKKELDGDNLILIVPMDTVFPIKTQMALPGCRKVIKSLDAEGGALIWDLQFEKKSLRIYGLQNYLELKFSPDLNAIKNPKLREIISKIGSDKALTPQQHEEGYIEVRIPKLKGELEITLNNGKQSVEVEMESKAKIISAQVENYSDAIKELIFAAEAGDKDSQYTLAMKFHEGDGVKKNLPAAAGWYTFAMKQGDAVSRNNIALMYLHGEGVIKNKRKAAKLFKIGADANNAISSRNLGFCYLEGLGVDKNVNEAIKYFKKSAEGGHTAAYFDLGVTYGDPNSGVTDMDKSVEFFEKASDAGHAAASFNLGLIYSGRITAKKKDAAKSILYYQKAHKQGFKGAAAALKQLNAPLE